MWAALMAAIRPGQAGSAQIVSASTVPPEGVQLARPGGVAAPIWRAEGTDGGRAARWQPRCNRWTVLISYYFESRFKSSPRDRPVKAGVLNVVLDLIERAQPMPHGDARLKLRIFNICSGGGVAAVAITLIGWLIAGLLPLPLGPANTMQEVVDFYTTDTTRRMFGFMLSTLGVCLALPLIGIITMHMQRMERRLPVLSMVRLCAGAVTLRSIFWGR